MSVPWQAVAVAAAVGTVSSVGAGYRLLRERALRRGGVRTHALVVDQDEHYAHGLGGFQVSNRSGDPGRPTRWPWAVTTGDGGGLVQAPIVEFTTADGHVVRTRSRVSTNASSVVPGRPVTVYYDPADPREVAIVGHGLGILRLFVAVGLLALGIAVCLAVLDEETLTAGAAVGVPVILGSAFLGVGGFGIGQVWVLRRRGVVTEGLVVGEETSSTREGLTLYHPVVRFTLPTGHSVRTASGRGTLRRRAAPGQTVRLRYHPDDPGRMLLVGDGARPLYWLFAVVGLVVLGGTATIATLVVL